METKCVANRLCGSNDENEIIPKKKKKSATEINYFLRQTDGMRHQNNNISPLPTNIVIWAQQKKKGQT